MKHQTETAEALQDVAEGIKQARALLARISTDMSTGVEGTMIDQMETSNDLARYETRDPKKVTDDAWMRRQSADLFPKATPPQVTEDPKAILKKQVGRSKTLPMTVTIPSTKTVAELISLLRLNGFSISTMQQQKGSDS